MRGWNSKTRLPDHFLNHYPCNLQVKMDVFLGSARDAPECPKIWLRRLGSANKKLNTTKWVFQASDGQIWTRGFPGGVPTMWSTRPAPTHMPSRPLVIGPSAHTVHRTAHSAWHVFSCPQGTKTHAKQNALCGGQCGPRAQ